MSYPSGRGQKKISESNPLSYIPDGRSAQRDYYKLENRERQLEAVDGLSAAEKAFVLGNVSADDLTSAGASAKASDKIKLALNKLHERDLISMRALIYLQRLADTSAELSHLKTMTGLNTREEIAEFIAEKQLKKLMMTQLEVITGDTSLKDVYKATVKQSANSFLDLWK